MKSKINLELFCTYIKHIVCHNKMRSVFVIISLCLHLTLAREQFHVITHASEHKLEWNGHFFCQDGFISNSSVVTTHHFDWHYDSPWSPLFEGSVCVPNTQKCGPNERALFTTDPSKADLFRCFCTEGFARSRSTQACAACLPSEVCPFFSDQQYHCPLASFLARQHKTPRLIAEIEFCYPESNFRLERNFLDYGYRFSVTTGSDLYTSFQINSCADTETKNSSTAECQCKAGYYRTESGTCEGCQESFYCHDEQKLPCPVGRTSLPYSSQLSQCSAPACPLGKYVDSKQNCTHCPTDAYCMDSKKITCPQHAVTGVLGAHTLGHCRCLPGFVHEDVSGVVPDFVCLWKPDVQPNVSIDKILFPASSLLSEASWRAPWQSEYLGAVVTFHQEQKVVNFSLVYANRTIVSISKALESDSAVANNDWCEVGKIFDVAHAWSLHLSFVLICRNYYRVLPTWQQVDLVDGEITMQELSFSTEETDQLTYIQAETYPFVGEIRLFANTTYQNSVIQDPSFVHSFVKNLLNENATLSVLPPSIFLKNFFTTLFPKTNLQLKCKTKQSDIMIHGTDRVNMWLDQTGDHVCLNTVARVHVIVLLENTTSLTLVLGAKNIIQWPLNHTFSLDGTGFTQTIFDSTAMQSQCIDVLLNVFNTTDQHYVFDESHSQNLTTCFDTMQFFQRVGETEIVFDDEKIPDNVSVAGTWNLTLHFLQASKQPAHQSCFDVTTCSFRQNTTSLRVPYSQQNLNTVSWGLGSRQKMLQKMVTSNDSTYSEHWVIANVVAAPCPANAEFSSVTQRCLCRAGYKEDTYDHCVPCSILEHCPGHGQTPEPCSMNASSVSARFCACGRGYYWNGLVCTECPVGYECKNGILAACDDNMVATRDSGYECACESGWYLDPAQQNCRICPKGFYCQGQKLERCPSGYTTSNNGAQSQLECICAVGYYLSTSTCKPCDRNFWASEENSESCLPCPENMMTQHIGSWDQASCFCKPGFVQHNTTCVACSDMSRKCEHGVSIPCGPREHASSDFSRCVCDAGFFRPKPGENCRECLPGFFCNEDKNVLMEACPDLMTSRLRASDLFDCFCSNSQHLEFRLGGHRFCTCPTSSRSGQTDCEPCHEHSSSLISSVVDVASARTCYCDPGFYHVVDIQGQPKCLMCEAGFFCPGTRFQQSRIACPARTVSVFSGAISSKACIPCSDTVSAQNAAPSPHEFMCFQEYFPFSVQTSEAVFDATPEKRQALFSIEVSSSLSDLQLQAEFTSYIVSALGLESGIQFETMQPISTNSYSMSWSATEEFEKNVLSRIANVENEIFDAVILLLQTSTKAHKLLAAHIFCLLVHEALRAHDMTNARCEHSYPSSPILQSQVMEVAWKFVGTENLNPLIEFEHVTDPNVLTLYNMLFRHYREKMDHGQYLLENFYDALEILQVEKNNFVFSPTSIQGRDILQTIDQFTKQGLEELVYSSVIAVHSNLDEDLCRLPLPITQAKTESETTLHDCGAVVSTGQSGFLCSYCTPGVEFRNMTTGVCQSCTTFDPSTCATIEPCCQYTDTKCVQVDPSDAVQTMGRCGDGKIDLDDGEECDFADPATMCCDSKCKLFPGYYRFPWCSTVCGDGIVAGDEVCDDAISDSFCNPVTCRCFTGYEFDNTKFKCVSI